MGLLDRLRGSGPGEAGTAVVLASKRVGRGDNGAGGWNVLDLAVDHFGSWRYTLRLEVRLAGREPYALEGEWKVPNRALGTLGGGGGVLPAGVELPVRAGGGGDATRVEIDWDAFRAQPGRKAQLKAGQTSRTNANVAAALARNPKLQQRLRANNHQAVHSWAAAAVRAGSMSREDFERNVQLNVDCGRMDPADAQAARDSL